MLNSHMCRNAFPGLGWMTSYSLPASEKCQKSLDTPRHCVITASFITLKMSIRLTFLPCHFPASWLSGQNAVVLSTPNWAGGGTLHPMLPLPTWDHPRHLLPAPLAPSSSLNCLPCHEEHHIFFFWLAAAVQTAWSSTSPLKEQYLCSSYTRYQRALVMFKKRTLVSFPVHCRRHMFGISIKSGNHVKLFEVLGSVQKALKTDDLKPWKYFNLPTLISAKNSTCEKNKPKLLLFY